MVRWSPLEGPDIYVSKTDKAGKEREARHDWIPGSCQAARSWLMRQTKSLAEGWGWQHVSTVAQGKFVN